METSTELFNIETIKRLNETFEMEYVKNAIKQDFITFDIGANIGIYSLLLSDLVGPKGHVYAFEPNKDLFRVKKENVTLINVAVSEKAGKGKLYLCKTNNGDGRIFFSSSDPNRKTMDIDIIKIDDFIDNNDINRLDFVKIDIQGSEPLAIKGMANALKKFSPIVFTEFWPYGYNLAGFKSVEFIGIMHELGYRHRVIENTCTQKDKTFNPYSIDYLLEKSQMTDDWTANLIWKKQGDWNGR